MDEQLNRSSTFVRLENKPVLSVSLPAILSLMTTLGRLMVSFNSDIALL